MTAAERAAFLVLPPTRTDAAKTGKGDEMADDNVTTTTSPIDSNVTGGGEQPGGEARTFTQSEMDAIIADRLRRQKAQFSDYADLKAKADRLAELEQAQMTELEQAQAKATAAEAERDAALQRANDRLIMAALTAEAAKQGFADPADAFTLADLAGVSIADDGAVTGVTEAVKALAQAKPYLIGRRTAPATDAGAGSGDRATGGSAIRLTDEELQVAKRMGLSPEEYAKGKTSGSITEGSVVNELNALRAENRSLRQRLSR
jgi:hypothetical protein